MTTRKTAPAVALFFGRDSYGRPIEVAYRADGQPFYRVFGYNGYGAGWSRWRWLDCDKSPTLEEACKSGKFSWGFKTLEGGRQEGLTFRLPTKYE